MEMMADSKIWEEIDQSESYLVSSMYEEALSLASSTLKVLLENKNIISEETVDGLQFYDMMESAGMVLVQSLKGLGRSLEILNELKLLFVPFAAIPVKVLLTGVVFQISEDSISGVREILEEFLSKWVYADEGYYILVDKEVNMDSMEEYERKVLLDVDVYMEVVEVYAVKVLGMILKDVDLAISWVEKAALPEDTQQVLLRRLHSLYSHKTTNASQRSPSLLPKDNHEAQFPPESSIASGRSLDSNYLLNGEIDSKQPILKFSKQENPFFRWFRSIMSKFGKTQLTKPNGRIVLSCFIFLLYYVLRRKQAALMRIFRRQVFSAKKVLSDLWQLAFSYQVNPLAAVQPLPAATRAGH
ncbi:protein APEM9 [Carica papaya]|uniref:protein APEM9 n=1 Tax=Carica papaya TaxID=3649 RepID=UPI000B8D0B72|nr:protein APEM9 [Carica papaya]XP_021891467.1 protein APEM9 [Carica papaya]XP_021891468.1 protein APEM9 [Carica papaya]XP_021891469.1 protein APEM9 [Carica papaya]XP_021891470.1 protein APEM9 [Carica papaya]